MRGQRGSGIRAGVTWGLVSCAPETVAGTSRTCARSQAARRARVDRIDGMLESNPYRSKLDEIRTRVIEERRALEGRRTALGKTVRALPRALRRDLERLETELSGPLDTEPAARSFERALAEYADCLETALCFADHAERARRARRRRAFRVASWVLPGALILSVPLLAPMVERMERACDSVCYEDGRCTLRLLRALAGAGERACALDDAEGCGFVCRAYGACTVAGDRCVAATDADCRQSLVCALEGRCTVFGGRCIASSEAECRASEQCRIGGRCSWVGEVCLAVTAADCARSQGCRLFRNCALDPRRGCVSPEEICRNSPDCEQAGLCSPGTDGRCIAAWDADCQHGRSCVDRGATAGSQPALGRSRCSSSCPK